MQYQQPTHLQAAILDWAGTVVDFGSFAPTQIFVEAFAEFDVRVSIEEARGPMGMGKWDHIRTLCDQPQVAERYRKVFGRTPTDDDVTAIYNRFMAADREDRRALGTDSRRAGHHRPTARARDQDRFLLRLPESGHG